MVNTNKIWVRFLVVFLIHIVIKSFDLSFPGGPFELNVRSLAFTVYFIVYGLFVWQLAEWFDKKLHVWIDNPEGSRKKTILITFYHAVFGYFLMFTVNHFYRLGDIYLFGNYDIWKDIAWLNPELTVALLSLYLIIYGINSYTIIHYKLREGDLKAEQLKKENIIAQYQALKAQIEPHFLFNSLSVLSSLVYEDADHSANFIVKLSKTLRYIIQKNEFNLVKLSEEMEFLEAYFFLIKTRLDDGVFLKNELDISNHETIYIPPVTLQLLVENAVNHNTYNPNNPLKIQIEKEGDYIVVRNNLNTRTAFKESTKQGLKNISKRYELISAKQVEIEKTNTEFIVKIPALNLSDYERFNI